MGGWGPSSCGQCYKLCTTGGSVNNDVWSEAGKCVVVKITNNCADGYPTVPGEPQKDWCSQNIPYSLCAESPETCMQRGSTNMYGYPVHFDLMNLHKQVTSNSTGLGWENPEVTWEAADCTFWTGPEWNCQAAA